MFRFLRVKEENGGQLEPYHNISWIQWRSAELVTPARTDFASLSLLAAQFWQCDIIAVVAAISPPPFFFFSSQGALAFVLVGHSHHRGWRTDPGNKFLLLHKGCEGERGWATEDQLGNKNIWTGSKTEEVSTHFHSQDIKYQVNCFSGVVFLNSYNGPVFVLALITEVKLLIQPSDAHYVWTFGEFQFWENH